MKCTRCKTNVDREATDRGICFDCYCQLDLQDYEAHLKASLIQAGVETLQEDVQRRFPAVDYAEEE